MTRSEKLADALFDCITCAPQAEQAVLFEALEAFRAKTSRTYISVRRHSPFASRLIEAIEEAENFVRDMEPVDGGATP
jgi:hypothetical protein